MHESYISYSFRNDIGKIKFVSHLSHKLDIHEKEYENALQISRENDFQFRFRRPTNWCFGDTYFGLSLFAWETNTDI